MTLADDATLVRPSVPPDGPRTARFTKAEYLRMIERGVFEGRKRRVFLFRGELIEMASMGWQHWHGVQRTNAWAIKSLGKALSVACQLPTDAPEDSVPEPDVAVYLTTEVLRRPYPNRAELFIEVADSSLKFDREMAHEYAVTAREYWILDVNARVLYVYRNPHADPAGMFGVAYDPPIVFAEADGIAPLCEPAASVIVRDLLPPLAP